MGAETSKQIDFSLNHPKFSNSKLVINEKQRVMQTNIGTDSKAYDSWKNKMQKSPISPQFLLLPIKEQFSSKGLCGSSGTLTLDFNDYPYLLTEEIANRKGKKKLFSENQLWYLFYALISAKKSMDPAFSKIGDVRPHNIFINDQGQIKVSNIHSWPHEVTNYTKVLDNEVTYLAPQQIKQLEQGALENQTNSNSEIFSIGLTLLSAATLEDFTNVYDIKKFTFDNNRVTEKLNQFKLNRAYSDIFKGVVCNLCQFEEPRRVTPQQLWAWIEPHEKSIKARENFFIPSAPEKIHHEVTAIRQFINLHSTGGINSSIEPIRESLTGQKLNFPPPIVRTSIPQNSSFVHTYTGFSNPLVFNAESTYIPASKSNVPDLTVAPTGTGITGQNLSSNKKNNEKTGGDAKVETPASDKKN